MLTLIIFLLTLGVLVFVHELGHFLAAIKQGIAIEEFGFGFPPRIFGLRRRENGPPSAEPRRGRGGWKIVRGNQITEGPPTVYSLNWIPLGGFVRIKGEGGEKTEEKDSFASRGVGQRALVAVMGVLFNIILAIVLLSFGYAAGLPQALDENIPSLAKVSNKKIEVVAVLSGTPAEKAGLKETDEILKVAGLDDLTVKNFQNFVKDKVGQEINLSVRQGGENKEIILKPEILAASGQPGVGVGLMSIGTVRYPLYLALPKGAQMTWVLTKAIVGALGGMLRDLVLGHKVAVEVTGPVGIAVMTGEAARLGWIYLLQFVAVLSINLAIVNFLPLPALDGGRLLFLLLEKLRRRPMGRKIELTIQNLSFSLLLLLVAFITYRDIARYSGAIGNWLGKLVK